MSVKEYAKRLGIDESKITNNISRQFIYKILNLWSKQPSIDVLTNLIKENAKKAKSNLRRHHRKD